MSYNIQKNQARPSLGFDLDELAGTLAGYEPSAQAPAPVKVGRPRSLARDARPVSVRLDGDQRRWLLQEGGVSRNPRKFRHPKASLTPNLVG